MQGEYPVQKEVHGFPVVCIPLQKAVIIISINVQVRQDHLQIYSISLSKEPPVCASLFSMRYMMERIEEVDSTSHMVLKLKPIFQMDQMGQHSIQLFELQIKGLEQKRKTHLRCIEGRDQAWILSWLFIVSLGPKEQYGHKDSTSSSGKGSSAFLAHRHNSWVTSIYGHNLERRFLEGRAPSLRRCFVFIKSTKLIWQISKAKNRIFPHYALLLLIRSLRDKPSGNLL